MPATRVVKPGSSIVSFDDRPWRISADRFDARKIPYMTRRIEGFYTGPDRRA